MSVQTQKAEATHKLYRRWMSALLESAQELLASKDQVSCCQMHLLVLRKLLCHRKEVCMSTAHLNISCLHVGAAPLATACALDASGSSPAANDRS